MKEPNYVLSCCSTADVTPEFLQRRQIRCVSFHYFVNDRAYIDDFGQSMPLPEFYRAMAEGASTRTSQVNISEYVDFFSETLKTGKDVVHVCLSSGISGTVNSALNAALIVQERFPGRKVTVVDSLGASSGIGLLLAEAADRRDEGMSADELTAWLEKHRLCVHHWFFSTDLSCYVKGGRLSKTAATFGGLLEICPLLNMDRAGKLTLHSKVRTKKRVIREIVHQMEKHAEAGITYSGRCYISHADCEADARELAAQIEESFPALRGTVEIFPVGTCIGSHTGPGTVALFFIGDERE